MYNPMVLNKTICCPEINAERRLLAPAMMHGGEIPLEERTQTANLIANRNKWNLMKW